MKRDPLLRLHDMLENIDAIEEMMEGRDFAAFRADLRTSRAVERCLEIISEASRRVPDQAKAAHPEIPWPEIAAFGNLLRHEYQRVDSYLVWKTATHSLEDLRAAIVDLIARSEKERDGQ